MLNSCRTSLKTMRVKLTSILALVAMFVMTTGFVQPYVDDQAKILEPVTKDLILSKNNRYLQTKEQPQISVITVKRLDKLTPPKLNSYKRTAFIVVGKKGKKQNVQIYSSKDLHGAFTADSRMNIIRAAADKLRSPNKATFNEGIRFVFRACATKIDQEYQYTLDKYDLSNDELNQISHPRRVALPVAFGIAVIVMGLAYLFRTVRAKQENSKD